MKYLKNLNFVASILFATMAFYMAWTIDVEQTHRGASSVAVLGIMAGMRFSDFCQEIAAEVRKKSKRKKK